MDPEKTLSVTEANPPSADNSATDDIYLIDPVYGLTKRGLSGPRRQHRYRIVRWYRFVPWSSGPLSVVLAYIIYSLTFIYPCNIAVGEMATYLPIRGSIFEFAKRYIDSAFGFALGWTYFYSAAMLLCAELSAVATVVSFWDSKTNPAAWVAIALVVMILLNIFAVKYYGESEFVMAVSCGLNHFSANADLVLSPLRSC
jgi:amino acid transporter